MNTRIVALLILSVGAGFGLSVFATPVFCIFRKIFIVPFLKKKILRDAIRQGHVVQAYLIDESDVYYATGGDGVAATNQRRYIYRYEYEGKTYRYRGYSSMQEASEITLYFQWNPRRATTARDLGFIESNWKKYFLVLATIFAIGIFIAGMCL